MLQQIFNNLSILSDKALGRRKPVALYFDIIEKHFDMKEAA
jgi:hypothetical protein